MSNEGRLVPLFPEFFTSFPEVPTDTDPVNPDLDARKIVISEAVAILNARQQTKLDANHTSLAELCELLWNHSAFMVNYCFTTIVGGKRFHDDHKRLKAFANEVRAHWKDSIWLCPMEPNNDTQHCDSPELSRFRHARWQLLQSLFHTYHTAYAGLVAHKPFFEWVQTTARERLDPTLVSRMDQYGLHLLDLESREKCMERLEWWWSSGYWGVQCCTHCLEKTLTTPTEAPDDFEVHHPYPCKCSPLAATVVLPPDDDTLHILTERDWADTNDDESAPPHQEDSVGEFDDSLPASFRLPPSQPTLHPEFIEEAVEEPNNNEDERAEEAVPYAADGAVNERMNHEEEEEEEFFGVAAAPFPPLSSSNWPIDPSLMMMGFSEAPTFPPFSYSTMMMDFTQDVLPEWQGKGSVWDPVHPFSSSPLMPPMSLAPPMLLSMP